MSNTLIGVLVIFQNHRKSRGNTTCDIVATAEGRCLEVVWSILSPVDVTKQRCNVLIGTCGNVWLESRGSAIDDSIASLLGVTHPELHCRRNIVWVKDSCVGIAQDGRKLFIGRYDDKALIILAVEDRESLVLRCQYSFIAEELLPSYLPDIVHAASLCFDTVICQRQKTQCRNERDCYFIHTIFQFCIIMGKDTKFFTLWVFFVPTFQKNHYLCILFY